MEETPTTALDHVNTEILAKNDRIAELEREIKELKETLEKKDYEIRQNPMKAKTPGNPIARITQEEMEPATPLTPVVADLSDEAIMATPMFQRLQGQLKSMAHANELLESKLSVDTGAVIDDLRKELQDTNEAKVALERDLSEVETQKARVNEELSKWVGDGETNHQRVDKLKAEIVFLQRQVLKLQKDLSSTLQTVAEREAHDVRIAHVLKGAWDGLGVAGVDDDEEAPEEAEGEAVLRFYSRKLARLVEGMQRESVALAAVRDAVAVRLDEMIESMEVLIRERDVAQRACEADERKASLQKASMKRQIEELEVGNASLEAKIKDVESQLRALEK
ncbi:Chromosome partition protein Smc [Carpediemonas membranifera]|uniref:Chromosome partition protein Smc n=1 Tax=Carpediemonas membranifera TaxID=201153 RepID=A0A8J6ATZ2_9EUKA|nr:Chromosome partition protein Smc [Carpediemonas membranifera]|eukprot:KAG9391440.1 Chromosome partition protein Smc [Carpediemonas membranifera]